MLPKAIEGRTSSGANRDCDNFRVSGSLTGGFRGTSYNTQQFKKSFPLLRFRVSCQSIYLRNANLDWKVFAKSLIE